MAWHSKYWTCSNFADWVRGTPKLGAGTSKEWAEWKRTAKAAHPFRFWLAEEALDKVQDVWTWIPDRINNVRYYLNNRFLVHTHALTAHPRDIKPGNWCDVGNRFLPCMFNELVNFVEVEKAWMMVAWADEETQKKYELPTWRKHWWSRWFMEWRCPQAGLDHLEWEINLKQGESYCLEEGHPDYDKPTPQSERAMEVKALYLWWTQDRPKRVDPYDASGWSDICEKRRNAYPDEILPEETTDEERAETRGSLDALHFLEERYEDEDEEMMIRLIKTRQSLWT